MQPHLNVYQARWLEQLAELDYHIANKPGLDNLAADVLSHYGCHVEETGNINNVGHSLADV